MGRKALVEQRRIEIGRAFQECVIENGSYDNTSIKDIATKAGVAAGIIHHYFDSKEEILIMMANLSYRDFGNKINEILYFNNHEERMEMIQNLLQDTSFNRFLLTLNSLSMSNKEVKRIQLAIKEDVLGEIETFLTSDEDFNGNTRDTAERLYYVLVSAAYYSAIEVPDNLASTVYDNIMNVYNSAQENI